MRAVVQRVSEARVTVGHDVIGEVNEPGLFVLVGVTHNDTDEQAKALAKKLYTLRILAGERCCADDGAPLLVVSQFTLYADTSKGRRPSWHHAAPADVAEPLVDAVVDELRSLGATDATGAFGADMRVHLVNDGPVTIVIDIYRSDRPRSADRAAWPGRAVVSRSTTASMVAATPSVTAPTTAGASS